MRWCLFQPAQTKPAAPPAPQVSPRSPRSAAAPRAARALFSLSSPSLPASSPCQLPHLGHISPLLLPTLFPGPGLGPGPARRHHLPGTAGQRRAAPGSPVGDRPGQRLGPALGLSWALVTRETPKSCSSASV